MRIKNLIIIIILFSALVYADDNSSSSSPRIFCIVKSYLDNFKRQVTEKIVNIWAHKCDDYRVIMIIPDEYRPSGWQLGKQVAIDRPFKILQPESLTEEHHWDLTKRVFHAIMYVYENYPNFDWYYVIDDDAYVNMKNLRRFLNDKNSSELFTYGYTIQVVSFCFA